MAHPKQPRMTDPERDERVTLPVPAEDAIRALLATEPPEERSGAGRRRPRPRRKP